MSGLLAATLIAKDEAALIGACLDSIADVVDEIVVVDTGSTDATAEIALAAGARVIRRPWSGSFSEARNAALDQADCEWILYIDADERLAATSRRAVESLLRHAPEVAFRIFLQPNSLSTPYREYRLWRHDPRIRFEGVIHEKVVPSIQRVGVEDGRPIGLADLLLIHVGYEGDQERKHRRNLPLLRKQLDVEPHNLFNLHHLARVLEGLGEREEAELVLAGAADVARRMPSDPLGSLVLADLLRLRHLRGDDVGELVREARSLFPSNWHIVFLEARYLVDHDRFEAALRCFDQLLSVDAGTLPDSGPAYDRRIFGALAQEGRAFCLFQLGQYEKAASAYAAASRLAPDDRGFALKQRVALARAGTGGSDRRRPTRAGAVTSASSTPTVQKSMPDPR
jgi:tetratricopeptide (TPR) repeat protein